MNSIEWDIEELNRLAKNLGVQAEFSRVYHNTHNRYEYCLVSKNGRERLEFLDTDLKLAMIEFEARHNPKPLYREFID